MNLTGTGFGFIPSDVSRVTVGSLESPLVRFISRTLVQAEIPSGIGANLDVVVTRRDGLRSTPMLFSYAAQRITTATPEYLIPGVGNVMVLLRGSNIAIAATQLTSV